MHRDRKGDRLNLILSFFQALFLSTAQVMFIIAKVASFIS